MRRTTAVGLTAGGAIISGAVGRRLSDRFAVEISVGIAASPWELDSSVI